MSPKRPEQVAPSRTLFTRTALAVLLLAATPLRAAPELALSFPAAAQTTYQHSEDLASFSLAKGPFEAGDVPSLRVEGAVHQIAWRIAMPKPSTMELLQSLRAQIEAAGFAPLFQCETQDCGGFDFRFASAVLPEPEMHVDLGDFRYLAAKRQGAAGAEYLVLMISRSPDAGFVQMTQIGGARALVMTPSPEASELPEPVLSLPAQAATPAPTGEVAQQDVAQQLEAGLPLVLEDLVFPSGSAALADEAYPSLAALAAWLRANPAQSVTLVGHTDASGGLAGNIALSKKRAASVRARLIESHQIPAAQISSDGVGPLAPRADDRSDAGRAKNRRVEVLSTPTQ
jgi:outer membrane protein OmpA-like peptidoglycan-associated protein